MSNTRNLNMLGKTGKGYSPTSPELPGKGTSLLSSLLPKLAGKGLGSWYWRASRGSRKKAAIWPSIRHSAEHLEARDPKP